MWRSKNKKYELFNRLAALTTNRPVVGQFEVEVKGSGIQVKTILMRITWNLYYNTR